MGSNLPEISMIEESTLSPDISALKEIKSKNVNRLVTGQLNINGISGKLEPLKAVILNYIDILIVTESKIDSSFTSQQLLTINYII